MSQSLSTEMAERLLALWESFVESVETGYEDSVDEYTNDLSARDVLEGVPTTGTSWASLRRQLTALDTRFEAATVPDNQARLAEFFTIGPGWWWRRLPRKVGGSLAATLGA